LSEGSCHGPVQALVLAGERQGGNALARALGLKASVFAEVEGRRALERVLDALRQSTSIQSGLLVGPDCSDAAIEDVLRPMLADGYFRWLPPAAGPCASALSGVAELESLPILLTAGDHALLTSELVNDFCLKALAQPGDLIVGLVPYALVKTRWPQSQRTVLRFRGGAYCGANLFLLKTAEARKVLFFWQQIEQDRKHPWRIARKLGGLSLARYALGWLSLDQALAGLSRKCAAHIGHVLIHDPRAAVDVDTLEDLALANEVLRNE
jgi:molybdopterin-guanine dinucleotide biosynthesis protein A